MSEVWENRNSPSRLIDLGPLPEVTESNTETTWKMFLQLQAQHSAGFTKTAPSQLGWLEEATGAKPLAHASVDEVMAEARRFNRVCPVHSQWLRLDSLLAVAGLATAPAALVDGDARRAPPLAKRMRLRDQVEWAARNGLLQEVYVFLASLSEDQWTHMGK